MSSPALDAALATGDLRIDGVLTAASNITTRVSVLATDGRVLGHGVYKPVRGERPLHDFPDGTLAGREVAAYRISEAGGWHAIPRTVLREGPLGPGSLQAWIGGAPPVLPSGDDVAEVLQYDEPDPEGERTDARPPLVDVLSPEEFTTQEGWLAVLQAADEDGRPLLVAHRDEPALAGVAVLDAVLNNADRKAAHLTRDTTGDGVWGFDHGLTCHTEPKLRTLLWGWAGSALPPGELDRLARLEAALVDGLEDDLTSLISAPETDALAARVRVLRETATFPDPPSDRSAVPWPLW